MFSALGVSFDLLGISETKQQTGKHFISNVNIEGYHIYTQPSRSVAGGVAICVNVRNLITSKVIVLVFCMMNLNPYGLKLKTKKKKFLSGCFYRHPNIDISNFMDCLESTFSNVNQKKYQMFFLGDFNIDFNIV